MPSRPKRPGDFAQIAKLVVDIATGQAPPDPPIQPESPRAIVGRKGGLKGGKARAHGLSIPRGSGHRTVSPRRFATRRVRPCES